MHTEQRKALEELYEATCAKISDIKDHLPKLRAHAGICDHVTEFGVRGGNSTIALLAGQPKTLISYDLVNCDVVKELKALECDTQFRFIVGDSKEVEIEETDMLFIDTHHTCKQLSIELEKHCDKVKKWIVMHDTETFGSSDEGGGGMGLMYAIEEFLVHHNEWGIQSMTKACNGLMILNRLKSGFPGSHIAALCN
jgi:hypothetical protein